MSRIGYVRVLRGECTAFGSTDAHLSVRMDQCAMKLIEVSEAEMSDLLAGDQVLAIPTCFVRRQDHVMVWPRAAMTVEIGGLRP